MAFLAAFKVEIHCPGADIARRAAVLASRGGLSIADRFAAATAEALGARLHTTDRVLGKALSKRKIPVTMY